jgi:hypothetical protein
MSRSPGAICGSGPLQRQKAGRLLAGCSMRAIQMALQDAELRFPVRIRIGIPPEGLGNRLGQMNAWLDANWASNSDLAALRSVGVARRYIISPWLPATAPRIGAFGMNSDFVDDDAEFAWMTRLSRETERPVWFLLTDRAKDPARVGNA